MSTFLRFRSLLIILAVIAVTSIACEVITFAPTPAAPAPTTEPIIEETPAAHEKRALNICIQREPKSLYPFSELNDSARAVLAAIYDAPIDTVNYKFQPGILTQVPTLENGDAQIFKSAVEPGAQIVDADGNLAKLEPGLRVRPAGCRADDCILTYDGTSPLEMDQVVVTFRIRKDLMWSDGIPVTAEDSVYAFKLASSPQAFGTSFIIDRTQIYEATDGNTLQWWGKPGFIDPAYETNFFPPAPEHLWSKFPIEQMPEIDLASRAPMGWGPYAVKEWASGDYIKLEKNRFYYREVEGYPKFDEVYFRFVADPEVALTELLAGRCDVIDPSIPLDNLTGLLLELEKGEQAQAFFVPGMSVEWLAMGVTPATYDDGYNINFQIDRQDIFGDPHTRQGLVYCLDRQAVVENVLFGLTTIPDSYIPVAHPVYDPNVRALPYDPSTGISLLEQAGWRDTDGNPETPRVAVTVKNVRPGTPLQLNYYTTSSTQRKQVTEIFKRSLYECGIGINEQYFSQNELYSPGPGGYVFGRNFDLAEYAMGVPGIVPACEWFVSSEIPTAENGWIGTNLTGYKNSEYDTICRKAQLALSEETQYIESYRQTQVIFADELPAVPLFYRLRIAAARPDLCGFELDATANPLWNIEAFDIGEACRQ